MLSHANSDVRMSCVDIIVALYQKIGMEIRIEIEAQGRRIKPLLSQMMYKKMLDFDQNKGMQPIHETQEWAEQSPPGSAKGDTKWNKLKEMITSLAEEEAKKI